jgi:hypothetical protein
MKNLIALEELFLVLLSLFLFRALEIAGGWVPLLLLTPDLSMLGYRAGPQAGAFTYNLAHHKAVAVALYIIGSLMGSQPVQFAGLILLAHSSFDRILGYGLKYPDAFEHTHLGMIGRAAKPENPQ